MSNWIPTKDRLPPFDVPVVVLDAHRRVFYESHGNWKDVGTLTGRRNWRPYWCLIGERYNLPLESVTHWMPLPADPGVDNPPPAD